MDFNLATLFLDVASTPRPLHKSLTSSTSAADIFVINKSARGSSADSVSNVTRKSHIEIKKITYEGVSPYDSLCRYLPISNKNFNSNKKKQPLGEIRQSSFSAPALQESAMTAASGCDPSSIVVTSSTKYFPRRQIPLSDKVQTSKHIFGLGKMLMPVGGSSSSPMVAIGTSSKTQALPSHLRSSYQREVGAGSLKVFSKATLESCQNTTSSSSSNLEREIRKLPNNNLMGCGKFILHL